MVYVIAQVSDAHVGGPNVGSGDRLSLAIDEINRMSRRPDLVLLTGDNTHNGTPQEWSEVLDRLGALEVPWEAIAGNHDRPIEALADHRAIDAGPLRLVLLDAGSNVFTENDASWLDAELSAHTDQPTVVAIHAPPFETGIWWMDCVGLGGADRFETVVRRHPQVLQVLSGHVHRLIQTNWGGCSLWVCPSTAISVAIDLDPNHDPAETAEAPTFSLHAYTDRGVVSHLVPVGVAAQRSLIVDNAPDFVQWARTAQQDRASLFT
ncbi:MAG: metallophosphoesterase [Acidimicrobiales bacterium]